MPKVSIIVPAYNSAATLAETLRSLNAQTFSDSEIIVVNDGSTDDTARIALSEAKYGNLRLLRQSNRGLAGARNTGIAAAKGEYIGFCDADDLWEPGKLQTHVAHLDGDAALGVSYSGSLMIDENSVPVGQAQRPQLQNISAGLIFKRNPIGNGSSPVFRRAALNSITFANKDEPRRECWFDESFRQSEDIECWLRLALTSDWKFEGVPGLLTRYRVNAGGLSANTGKQIASWERMVAKLYPLDTAFFDQHTPRARAYQLRYLARRAISARDGTRATRLMRHSLRQSLHPIREEPVKSLTTIAAAGVLKWMGPKALNHTSNLLLALKSRPNT